MSVFFIAEEADASNSVTKSSLCRIPRSSILPGEEHLCAISTKPRNFLKHYPERQYPASPLAKDALFKGVSFHYICLWQMMLAMPMMFATRMMCA